MLRRSLIFALLVLASSRPVFATWYGENVAKGADIMMMDVRWPWWPESTYFANWNYGLSPGGITAYGGFAVNAPTIGADHRPNLDGPLQDAVRPGSVWSYWGANAQGEPVRVEATSQFAYPRQYIGEGASGALGGPVWPYVSRNRWYTMLLRVWKPVGVKDPQYSFVGRWVKDVEGGAWHLYGIMRIPVPATSFTGNAGFLEDFGNAGRSVRSMYRRLGYYRKDGKWCKSDTVTYDVPARRGTMDTYWVVDKQPEGDHEILRMELSSNPALLPLQIHGTPLELGKKHEFTVKEPDSPALDKPVVERVSVTSNGKQVLVSWKGAAGSSPLFAYKIEVFDNPSCHGKPKTVREERMPTVRNVLLDCGVPRPTVRLTVTDLFDQSASPIVVRAALAAKPSSAVAVATAPGLEYELSLKDAARHVNALYPACSGLEENRTESHYWLSLNELKSGRSVQSGYSRGFDMDLKGDRQSGYAFRFRGLLRAPASGLYLLHMRGSDGYRISVDGKTAVVWDGPHGPADNTAPVNLAKGEHRLAVDYFVDQAPSPYFALEWEGPGMGPREVPLSALVHARTAGVPEGHISAQANGDGTASIEVAVDPKGRRLSKVRLFLGKLQIAEATGSRLAFHGAMPEGESTVWARLVYDRNRTVDTAPSVVNVAGPAVSGWALSIAGEAKALHGIWQSGPEAFSFFGEGEYVLSRKIQGDFTLTCRVDSWAGANGEPVNPSSWVGLTARENASRNNSGWGREFGVMQTAGLGLRTTPDSSDLAGSRVSDYELPKNRPWLRIARQGNQWTAWTSEDGATWEHGATHFIPARAEMDAGLVFRALPQDCRAYFQAKVSHLTLEPGVAKDLVLPVPVPARDTGGERLTGVVLAPSDANVVVVRSAGAGLLRSTNGGRTWAPANGSLSGTANCVRSVAIHPTDANTMVRAAGSASGGTFEGGLWITHDGGMSWQALDFPGDFDGLGPSALCGEVVAFDPANPQVLVAGCETKGFFRSDDGGKTWRGVGAAGNRITGISVNRWVRGGDAGAYIHAVTCPDSWMDVLGRGKPALSAEPTVARDYLSRDGGRTLRLVCEREDLGYLNVAFDKGAWPEELPYATTHGVLKALGDGERTFLFPLSRNLDCFRPVTALACSGSGDGQTGRCLTGALAPAVPARISVSVYCAYWWNWQRFVGGRPAGGLIALSGEFLQGKLWWILAVDGLYRSYDGGVTLERVLDEKGAPAGAK